MRFFTHKKIDLKSKLTELKQHQQQHNVDLFRTLVLCLLLAKMLLEDALSCLPSENIQIGERKGRKCHTNFCFRSLEFQALVVGEFETVE